MHESGEIERGERKGRLVEEWRNIISPSSRRGFVLHRLPLAPAPLHPPLSSSLRNLCYSEPSIVALATRRACVSECVCVCVYAEQSWACSHLQCEQFVSEVVQTVTQLF